jgi:hypothetical protein
LLSARGGQVGGLMSSPEGETVAGLSVSSCEGPAVSLGEERGVGPNVPPGTI